MSANILRVHAPFGQQPEVLVAHGDDGDADLAIQQGLHHMSHLLDLHFDNDVAQMLRTSTTGGEASNEQMTTQRITEWAD
jgi:hypothetical protein